MRIESLISSQNIGGLKKDETNADKFKCDLKCGLIQHSAYIRHMLGNHLLASSAIRDRVYDIKFHECGYYDCLIAIWLL